jgi:hypothetical protein
MTAQRRCGVYSHAGAEGCCRPLDHPDSHCVHPAEQLSGTPGLIVASNSMFGPRFRPCAGTGGGELDEHPGPGPLGAEGRAQRRWVEYLGQQPPEEGEAS